MKISSYLLSLLMVMGGIISSQLFASSAPLEKPDRIASFKNVPEDIKVLDVLLKENKLKEFYEKSRKLYGRTSPTSEDIVSMQNLFWFCYYVSLAPLLPFEDYDSKTQACFNDNIDLRLLKNVFDLSLNIARNDLDQFSRINSLERKELVQILSVYSARMLHHVRKAYVVNLSKLEQTARENYQKEILERTRRTSSDAKLDSFGGEFSRLSRNLENKIALNKSRNIQIESMIKGMERDFIPTLVQLFPGRTGEVIKYIRMAGYQDDEINDLMDQGSSKQDVR